MKKKMARQKFLYQLKDNLYMNIFTSPLELLIIQTNAILHCTNGEGAMVQWQNICLASRFNLQNLGLKQWYLKWAVLSAGVMRYLGGAKGNGVMEVSPFDHAVHVMIHQAQTLCWQMTLQVFAYWNFKYTTRVLVRTVYHVLKNCCHHVFCFFVILQVFTGKSLT